MRGKVARVLRRFVSMNRSVGSYRTIKRNWNKRPRNLRGKLIELTKGVIDA